MPPPRKRLGQLLVELAVVDEHQLQSALGHQRQWGGKLGAVLVQKGFCKESALVRVLSQYLGIPIVELAAVTVDPRALKMATRAMAEKLRIFPYEFSGSGRGEVLKVAMSEPSDLAIRDQLAFHTGKRIQPLLAGDSEITAAIAEHYSFADAREASRPGSGRSSQPAVSSMAATQPGKPPSLGASRPYAPPAPPASRPSLTAPLPPAPPWRENSLPPPPTEPVGQGTAASRSPFRVARQESAAGRPPPQPVPPPAPPPPSTPGQPPDRRASFWRGAAPPAAAPATWDSVGTSSTVSRPLPAVTRPGPPGPPKASSRPVLSGMASRPGPLPVALPKAGSPGIASRPGPAQPPPPAPAPPPAPLAFQAQPPPPVALIGLPPVQWAASAGAEAQAVDLPSASPERLLELPTLEDLEPVELGTPPSSPSPLEELADELPVDAILEPLPEPAPEPLPEPVLEAAHLDLLPLDPAPVASAPIAPAPAPVSALPEPLLPAALAGEPAPPPAPPPTAPPPPVQVQPAPPALQQVAATVTGSLGLASPPPSEPGPAAADAVPTEAPEAEELPEAWSSPAADDAGADWSLSETPDAWAEMSDPLAASHPSPSVRSTSPPPEPAPEPAPPPAPALAASPPAAGEGPAPVEEAEVLAAGAAPPPPPLEDAAALLEQVPAAEATVVEAAVAGAGATDTGVAEAAPAAASVVEAEAVEAVEAAGPREAPEAPEAPDDVEVVESTGADGEEATRGQELPEQEGSTTWEAVPDPADVRDSGWIGQALGEARELSAGDLAILSAVGVDPADGLGALRLVAGLLRLLEARHLIELRDLAADLRANRGPPPFVDGRAGAEPSDLSSVEAETAPPAGDDSAQVPWLELRPPDES